MGKRELRCSQHSTLETPVSNNDITAAASLIGKLGAHASWANTTDRSARTEPGRRAFNQRFLDEADGDPVRAEHLRKAYFARLALKSAQSRRRTSRILAEARKADPALDALLRGGATS